MRKLLRSILASILLLIAVMGSGIVTIVFFPQPLFAHQLQHKRFHVYANEELDPADWMQALDHAYELIEASELHDSSYHFNVFLAHGNAYNYIDDLLGKGPAARATAGNIVFKIPVDIHKDLTIGPRNRASFTQLLAHEMVHNLQAHRFGMLRFNPMRHPPLWKLEGYPEYVSRRTLLRGDNYDLKKEVFRFTYLTKHSDHTFVEVTPNHVMPAYYFKGRLMMEYLLDVRGMSYEQVLDDHRSEDEIWQEIITYVASDSSTGSAGKKSY